MQYNPGTELFWRETRWEKNLVGGKIRHLHVDIHETVHVVRFSCTLGSDTLIKIDNDGNLVLVDLLGEWLRANASNSQVFIRACAMFMDDGKKEDVVYNVDIKLMKACQAGQCISLASSLLDSRRDVSIEKQ